MMESLPRGRIEGVPEFGLAGFGRVQHSLEGGTEIACSGAIGEGDKGTEVAACGALMGRVRAECKL